MLVLIFLFSSRELIVLQLITCTADYYHSYMGGFRTQQREKALKAAVEHLSVTQVQWRVWERCLLPLGEGVWGLKFGNVLRAHLTQLRSEQRWDRLNNQAAVELTHVMGSYGIWQNTRIGYVKNEPSWISRPIIIATVCSGLVINLIWRSIARKGKIYPKTAKRRKFS